MTWISGNRNYGNSAAMSPGNFWNFATLWECLVSVSELFSVSTLTCFIAVTILSVVVAGYCAIVDDDDDSDVYGAMIMIKSVVKV